MKEFFVEWLKCILILGTVLGAMTCVIFAVFGLVALWHGGHQLASAGLGFLAFTAVLAASEVK